MKKKALLISFASHLMLLFGLIVAITFIRRDFDILVNGVISIIYVVFLSFYFIILLIILGRKEPKKEARLMASKKPSFKSALSYWIFVLLYVLVIFYISSLQSIPFANSLSELDPKRFSLHVVEYSGLAFFLYLALLNSGFTRKKAIFLTLTFCISVAYIDETLQISVPGRRFNIYDFYSDILGSLLGSIISGYRLRSRT
jgi:VanZ family protein